jgi:hypothetical protein
VGSTLFVPSTWRALVIRRPPAQKGETDRREPSPYSSEPSELSLGPMNEVLTSLVKKSVARGDIQELSVEGSDLGRWRIHLNRKAKGWMDKAGAVQALVCGCGLGEPEAVMLLKDAVEARSDRVKPPVYFLKTAYGEPPKPPSFPDPLYGDEYGIRAPVQYPQTQLENLSQNDDAGSRDLYRDDRYVDDSAKRYAVTASNMGQKEVMDTSVIGGLVKTLDAGNRVDEYIPDLMLALDRLGRILFMFYWHNDKFKDRFGQQDMIELEDNLRNVFKNLGEVTLYLKQKTIDPGQADSSEVELPEVFA